MEVSFRRLSFPFSPRAICFSKGARLFLQYVFRSSKFKFVVVRFYVQYRCGFRSVFSRFRARIGVVGYGLRLLIGSSGYFGGEDLCRRTNNDSYACLLRATRASRVSFHVPKGFAWCVNDGSAGAGCRSYVLGNVVQVVRFHASRSRIFLLAGLGRFFGPTLYGGLRVVIGGRRVLSPYLSCYGVVSHEVVRFFFPYGSPCV